MNIMSEGNFKDEWDHQLDELLAEMPLYPLPDRFTIRLVGQVAAVPQELPVQVEFSLAEIFTWRDLGIASLMTSLSVAVLVGGSQMLEFLLEAMAALVNPEWLPLILLTLVVQAAILAYVVWFFVADEDPNPRIPLLKR